MKRTNLTVLMNSSHSSFKIPGIYSAPDPIQLNEADYTHIPSTWSQIRNRNKPIDNHSSGGDNDFEDLESNSSLDSDSMPHTSTLPTTPLNMHSRERTLASTDWDVPYMYSFTGRPSHLPSQPRIEYFKEAYFNENVVKSIQPAHYFQDTLDVEFSGAQILDNNGHMAFSNNSSVSSNIFPIAIIADGSILRVYNFDATSGVLEYSTVLAFDTSPQETTEIHISAANSPSHPHSITHLHVGYLKGNVCEILVATFDDGRACVWDTNHIYSYFRSALKNACQKKCGADSRGTIFLNRNILKPVVTFQTPKSSWGIDIHTRLSLVAISSNDHRVHIYSLQKLTDYYMENLNNPSFSVHTLPKDFKLSTIPIAVSPHLPHNIPDVQFIEPSKDDLKKGFRLHETFYLTCTSISGHVAMWEFFMGETLKRFRYLALFHNELNTIIDADNICEISSIIRNNCTQKRRGGGNDFVDGLGRNTSAGLNEENEAISNFDQDSQSSFDVSHISHTFRNQLDDYEDSSESYTQAQLEEIEFSKQRLIFSNEIDDPAFLKIPFKYGRWMYIEDIKQDGWTINSVTEDDFLSVKSLAELTGNRWLNDKNAILVQAATLHKSFSIPGLNTEKVNNRNSNDESNPSSGHISENDDEFFDNANESNDSKSVFSERSIPLNDEFIDFSMGFSYFVIGTIPISNYENPIKYSNFQRDMESDPLSLSVFRPNTTSNVNSDHELNLSPETLQQAQRGDSATNLPSAWLPRNLEQSTNHSSSSNPSLMAVSDLHAATIGANIDAPELILANHARNGSHFTNKCLNHTRKKIRDWLIYKRATTCDSTGKSGNLLESPPLKNRFTILTSQKSVYLCRTESLFCNASQDNIFSAFMSDNEGNEMLARRLRAQTNRNIAATVEDANAVNFLGPRAGANVATNQQGNDSDFDSDEFGVDLGVDELDYIQPDTDSDDENLNPLNEIPNRLTPPFTRNIQSQVRTYQQETQRARQELARELRENRQEERNEDEDEQIRDVLEMRQRFRRQVAAATQEFDRDFNVAEFRHNVYQLMQADRCNMTLVLPAINAVIIASQAGCVSVFRMVKYTPTTSLVQDSTYKGNSTVNTRTFEVSDDNSFIHEPKKAKPYGNACFSLRQEFVIPVNEMLNCLGHVGSMEPSLRRNFNTTYNDRGNASSHRSSNQNSQNTVPVLNSAAFDSYYSNTISGIFAVPIYSSSHTYSSSSFCNYDSPSTRRELFPLSFDEIEKRKRRKAKVEKRLQKEKERFEKDMKDGYYDSEPKEPENGDPFVYFENGDDDSSTFGKNCDRLKELGIEKENALSSDDDDSDDDDYDEDDVEYFQNRKKEISAYRLVITYLDGLTLSYKISKPKDQASTLINDII